MFLQATVVQYSVRTWLRIVILKLYTMVVSQVQEKINTSNDVPQVVGIQRK